MYVRKSISTANKDIHLALKFFKRLTTDVERAESNHLTSYAKIPHKREIGQEEDEFHLKNTQCRNITLNKAIFDCKSFLERISKDQKNHIK